MKYLPAAIPGKFSQVADPRVNKAEERSSWIGVARQRAMAWIETRKQNSFDGRFVSTDFMAESLIAHEGQSEEAKVFFPREIGIVRNKDS